MSKTQLNKPNLEDQLQRLPVSNGSKDQELPPLESSSVAPWRRPARFAVEDQDCRDPSAEGTHEWTREQRDGTKKFALRLLDELAQREHQLREAIDQIATLAAQVEDLERGRKLDYAVANKELLRALKAEAELTSAYETIALKHGDVAIQRGRVEKAKAELAVLREGAKVTYQMQIPSGVRLKVASASEFEESRDSRKDWASSKLVEVTTRERILDTAGGEG